MNVSSGSFLAVGDLQRTSFLEVWRESNLAERRVLVEAIARERADFLVLLGDMVFRGDSRVDWADFDALTAPLAHLPKLPILGNHDYGVRRAAAMQHFRARFPGIPPYYERTYGPLRLRSGFYREVCDVVAARDRGELESVIVWTVNHEDRMRDLADVGVDGIITDAPTTLCRVLADRAPLAHSA